MKITFPPHIFIAGTDTEVGKTLVAAMLMKGLNAAYWKPIQSGDPLGTDTEWIQRYTELPAQRFKKETYRFREAISPHAAAALEGIDIDLEEFSLPAYTSEHLIIEGAGGLMVPLNKECFMIDLIKQLEAPVILVARSGLGTINHTLLSLEKLRQKDIPVLGVVMNGPENDSNRSAIEHFGKVPVWAVPPLESISPASLNEAYDLCFNAINKE